VLVAVPGLDSPGRPIAGGSDRPDVHAALPTSVKKP
jgi:hypothetical protein